MIKLMMNDEYSNGSKYDEWMVITDEWVFSTYIMKIKLKKSVSPFL